MNTENEKKNSFKDYLLSIYKKYHKNLIFPKIKNFQNIYKKVAFLGTIHIFLKSILYSNKI